MSALHQAQTRRRLQARSVQIRSGRTGSRRRRLLVLLGVLVLATAATTAQASAAPFWRLSSRAAPTNLAPGSTGLLVVVAEDLGDSGVKGDGSHVQISDALPQGLSLSGGAVAVRAHRSYPVTGEAEEEAFWSCESKDDQHISCSTSLDIPAYEALELLIPVSVAEPPGTDTTVSNSVSVQGGVSEEAPEAPVPSATLTRAVRIAEAQAPFGIEEDGYTLTPEDEGGSAEDRAGSHPFQLTANVNFNQTLETLPVKSGSPPQKGLQPASPGLAKDLSFNLPPGLLGNVTAAEQCPEADFSAIGAENVNFCPAGSAVGVATVFINIPKPYGYAHFAVPLFNLVPTPGEPARFGFEIDKVPIVLDTAVRTGGDYGVSVKVSNASEVGQLLGSRVTFWGVPGDPRHDASRGWKCLLGGLYVHSQEPCQAPNPRSLTPFLTLPTACTGELFSSTAGDSWSGELLEERQVALSDSEGNALEDLLGCPAVPFDPSIAVKALASEGQEAEGQGEGQQGESESQAQQARTAATPTGLQVRVKVSQEGTLSPEGLGDSDVEAASVTLPAGMTLNPSAANGLEACSEAQIGYQGTAGQDPLDPGAKAPLSFSEEPISCPQGSKLGVVHIKTPLLAKELSGSVYLAEPAPQGEANKNPFGSLIALYIVAESQALGLRVKLAGEGSIDPSTGQVTTTFKDIPQVPFSELSLRLFSGPRASLSTPSLCGDYRTSASFTPWSGAEAVSVLSPEGELQITEGQGGDPCPQTEPFAPTLSAGSQNPQAGAFSSFSLSLERPDGNQPLSALSVHLPQGAAAMLASVSPCGEPQAAQGSCGPASEIGKATASAGVGPDPYTESGRLYITGPYQGAPFGLEIVTPAVAGPFNLGVVVVRSKIEVDPHTAEVTIQGAIPTFLQGVGMPPTGIPLQLKRVHVEVDRPSFEFNPTSCEAKKIEATLSGAGGAQAQLSEPFQVQGCQSLPFKPTLTAQTEGRTSKANGASFLVKVSSTQGQANIAKTVLQVPKILPARLSTIQKACLAKTFEANPASCPEGSNIGQGIAHTPVLRSTLQGPAYLVSHGNAAWPDVEFVLQGEGITLILDGQTAIKDGVTTSSFNTVPDAPVSSFEAILPEGPHSALTTDLPPKAHYSLCGQKLLVPTTLTGQNGAVIKQSTKVSVSGCGAVKAAKAKKLSRAQKLKRALASCRRRYRHSKARRQSCEHKARRRFGPKKGKAEKQAKGHARSTRKG